MPCSARIWIGWFRNCRASATIGPGMVAENSMVWRAVGQHRHQLLDVGQEAEVEHLVGLVEHQTSDVAQLQVALLGQVEQPAGGADHDLDAPLERLDLRLVGAPAVDREDAGAELLAGRGDVTGDLHGELAGRRDHQGLRRRAGAAGQVEPVQQRHAEAEGLAGAGAGLADQVVAGQRDRQGEFLDREGAVDADRLERLDDLVLDGEV